MVLWHLSQNLYYYKSYDIKSNQLDLSLIDYYCKKYKVLFFKYFKIF